MAFDGTLTDPKLTCDFLVQLSDQQMAEDFPFAVGQFGQSVQHDFLGNAQRRTIEKYAGGKAYCRFNAASARTSMPA